MRSRLGIVAPASLLVAGCGTDMQSVLSPGGTQAGQIAWLAWLMFGFGTLILALVIASVWLAIGGSERTRRILAGERTVIALGIVLPIVTLTVLLGYGVWLMRPPPTADRIPPLQIEVVGEQWWWRITYAGAENVPVASANEIRIPVGQPVEFTLKASDVIHSFWVPSLGGKVDMIPGHTTRLRLTAERAGVYRAQCAEYCGGPHALMALPVVAMPADEYPVWQEREAAPASAPVTETERRGQTVFIAAGCGACHTVRGTTAAGTLGPDLTHIGSRRSVGVDTLPLTQANLIRFIVDGQHVKPGNLMPQFRVFRPEELDALGAYLAGLR